MKIAIFGANGGIGRYAVKFALERGYEVIANVRRKSDFLNQYEKANKELSVIVGSTSDT